MSSNINKLIQIMKLLRDPEKGCPWDIKQNFNTISPHTIEEAYEVAYAIDEKNFDNLKEELGDLLLQVIFHSQMASEINEFNFSDVVNTIISKLIRRHPHIFKKDKQDISSDEVILQWEKIKKEEKKTKKNSDFLDFEEIPVNFPSMLRAIKIQKKASSVGFDWEKIDDVTKKIEEEFNELLETIKTKNHTLQEEEMGDLLFSCINASRKLNIDPDEAIKKTNRKFAERYNKAEKLSQIDGKSFSDLKISEKEFYWQKAKK